MEETAFTWFSFLPFYRDEYSHIYGSLLVVLILIITGFIFFRKVSDKDKGLLPEGRFSLRDICEAIVEGIYNFMYDLVGSRAKDFFPIIGTLFILILFSNLVGLIPGLNAPTANINTNAAYAMPVFLVTHYYGVKEHGVRYLKHFIGPIWWLAVLVIPTEILTHIFRPITLSVRLFGNINGDHIALGIFSHLIPFGVPVVFMALGVFISFIQAFVFALLSLVYISLAIEH